MRDYEHLMQYINYFAFAIRWRSPPFAGQLSRLKTGITSLSVSSWMWIRILGDIRVKAPPIERPELCNFWRQGGPARWGEHPDRGRGDTFVSQFMSD